MSEQNSMTARRGVLPEVFCCCFVFFKEIKTTVFFQYPALAGVAGQQIRQTVTLPFFIAFLSLLLCNVDRISIMIFLGEELKALIKQQPNKLFTGRGGAE